MLDGHLRLEVDDGLSQYGRDAKLGNQSVS